MYLDNNNFQLSSIILDYYLQDEDKFFQLQNLLDYKNNKLYLSNEEDERNDFFNYLNNKDKQIAEYIENNFKKLPIKKFKF